MEILKKEKEFISFPLINDKIIKEEVLKSVEEAREILKKAKIKAEKIVEDAKKNSEKIEKEAYEKGYERGLKELNEIIFSFSEKKREFLEKNKSEVVKLAVKLAEKIIGEEIKTKRSTILKILEKAIRTTIQAESICVRVSPKNYEYIRENKGEILKKMDELKEIKVVSDEEIKGDGCIIESEIGTIDARIETQLKILEELLLGKS